MCIYTICKIPKYFTYFQYTKLSKFWLVAILEQENIPLKISPMIFTFGWNHIMPKMSTFLAVSCHPTCIMCYIHVSLDNQWNLLNDFRFCVCYTFSHWNQSYSYIAKGKFFRGACGSMTGLQNYCLLIFVSFSALEYQNNWMSSHFQAISR